MQEKITEFIITDKIESKLKNKNNLKKELGEGKTAQEILGFSMQTMAKFYRAASHLFELKRYGDAANAFLFLVSLNSANPDYWIGLGMSTQLSGNFDDAIDAYEMAAICEVNNPVPYFCLAKCFFAIHDRDSALQALDMTIEYASDKDEYSPILIQAKAARESLINASFG
jgi:type III secretion system low calcium response chaperone LcrH/SycD